MAVTQYIGARYVPIFAEPAEWTSTKQYEPLTIVLHQGNSFTSKQFVPVGVDIENTDYWAETGNYNAQVEQYRQEVLRFSDDIVRKSFAFDTVQDMSENDNLYVGAICHTNGFHETSDGGSSWYIISDTGTPNGMDVIACANGLYANMLAENCITPEMLGARADGKTDDSTIINYIIDKYGTVHLNPKTYYIASPILMTTRKYVLGAGIDTIILVDTSTDAFHISYRDCKVADLVVQTSPENDTTNCFVLPTGSDAHRIVFENIITYYFNNVFYNESDSVWNCQFNNIRVNYAQNAINIQGGFNNTFINFYEDRCKTAIKPNSMRATFIGCNFSITNKSTQIVTAGTNASLTFIECNFECDEIITNETVGFIYINAFTVFDSCRFIVNFNNSGTWMFWGTSVSKVIFKNSRYVTYSSGVYSKNAFNPASPIGGNVSIDGYIPGKMKFINCSDFPMPNYYAISTPNVIDYDNYGMITVATTLQETLNTLATRMKVGQLVYNVVNNKLGYSDGTNIQYLT